jgi:hypothetical protein
MFFGKNIHEGAPRGVPKLHVANVPLQAPSMCDEVARA